MRQRFLILGLIIGVFCLVGCGKSRIDLNVASQPNVNPDNSNRPSPIAVKIYELRTDLAFNQADFQSLFEHPVPTLGSDLIAADEQVYIPGEARKISYKPNPETRFVGIVAGFRQMDRAQWRVIRAVLPDTQNIVALEFNDTSIMVIPDKAAKDWEPEEAVKQFQQQMARDSQQPPPGRKLGPRKVTPTPRRGQAAPSSSSSSGYEGGSEGGDSSIRGMNSY